MFHAILITPDYADVYFLLLLPLMLAAFDYYIFIIDAADIY